MAKKEKSAIEAILELKNKKNKKLNEKRERLKAEEAKLKARIKKVELEERKKAEKNIDIIFSKISKDIKNNSGIIKFLKKDAYFLSEEELSSFFQKITQTVKKEVELMTEKVQNFKTEGDINEKEHVEEREQEFNTNNSNNN